MGKKQKKRCPYCNRLYAPSYLNTHIRRVHKREPPKLGAHRGKVKGRPNSYVQRDARGRFKKWTEIMPRGVRADKARESRTRPKKPGRGNRGDYNKR